LAFSPDGRQLLSGSGSGPGGGDRIIRLWDVETARLLRTFEGHTGAVHSVSYSSDGRFVLSVGGDKTARLWEAETGRLLHTFADSDEYLKFAEFSSDGKRVTTISYSGNLRFWDVATGQSLGRSLGLKNTVVASSDRRRAASAMFTRKDDG